MSRRCDACKKDISDTGLIVEYTSEVSCDDYTGPMVEIYPHHGPAGGTHWEEYCDACSEVCALKLAAMFLKKMLRKKGKGVRP